jgi:endonuclease/exonuclease/phosphatase family metal-dependent hydrolase
MEKRRILTPKIWFTSNVYSKLATTLIALALLTIALWTSSARVIESSPDPLLEIGTAAKSKVNVSDSRPTELKVVSYNIRWRGGDDLKKLIELLRTDREIGGASIIGMQEVDRNKQRTRNTNTARIMAEELGMHYVWAAPPNPRPKEGTRVKPNEVQEEETGVLLLSQYPLTDVERLVLLHEGPNRRRRVAIGATAQVGDLRVRVYSVHAETRMPVEKKIEQWATVLEDLKRYPKIEHVVVVGDFNTIEKKDVTAARNLYTDAGFATPFRDEDATFKVMFFDFKLDWIWVRGLIPGEFGIDKKIGLSDHWPLWAKFRFDKQPERITSGDGKKQVN